MALNRDGTGTDVTSVSTEPQEAMEAPGEPTIAPCKHMEGAINSLSDDTLRGPMRWYAQLHASHCKRCGPALRALRRLRLRMSLLKKRNSAEPTSLSEERRTALAQAMEEIDSVSNSGSKREKR